LTVAAATEGTPAMATALGPVQETSNTEKTIAIATAVSAMR